MHNLYENNNQLTISFAGFIFIITISKYKNIEQLQK